MAPFLVFKRSVSFWKILGTLVVFVSSPKFGVNFIYGCLKVLICSHAHKTHFLSRNTTNDFFFFYDNILPKIEISSAESPAHLAGIADSDQNLATANEINLQNLTLLI